MARKEANWRRNSLAPKKQKRFCLGICMLGICYVCWSLLNLSALGDITVDFDSSGILLSDSSADDPLVIPTIDNHDDMESRIIDISPSKPIILLGIFSVLNNNSGHDERRFRAQSTYKTHPEERRELIRSTYATHQQVCALHDYQTVRNPNCRMLYTFVVGANPRAPPGSTNTSNLVLDPSSFSESHDMTYLNIRENMNYGKTPTWFAYASTVAQELGIPFVAKADDDTLIQVHSLLTYMYENLPKRPERLYFGRENYDCVKNANKSLCEGLTPYNWATGEFYFLSLDLALYVTSLETTLKKAALEDVHMAKLVHSHPHPIDRHFLGFKNRRWLHPLKDAETFRARWNQMKDQELRPVYPQFR